MSGFDLKSYLSQIDSIKAYLNVTSPLQTHLKDLDNYLEQIKCINHTSLFSSNNDGQTFLNLDSSSSITLNKEEAKQKLLFKITSLLNENIQLIKATMLVQIS